MRPFTESLTGALKAVKAVGHFSAQATTRSDVSLQCAKLPEKRPIRGRSAQSAPQVIAATRHRLLIAADSCAARLVEIASSKSNGEGDKGGGVLWEEFLAIYRRRVGEEPGDGVSSSSRIS